ncbi:endonuclease III [Clostridium cylindrosporum]|uniref:Endonuclease III n=1 Tax=Clostridium cylindrosporum DSM 605 TaxID=1121307 RepID=A0A0J8D3S2_CLOCY|nr:endonuclease III [Clostridium cylindrosporum]KMT20820.1 endonuclease III [Clostridium cylindrosporum DSM 605]
MNVDEVIKRLEDEYKGMGCGLKFTSPFELLISTMLSAQTTDVNVNKATEVLYKVYNTPSQFASLTTEELEPYIRSLGFYKNKTKNIINTSKKIMSDFNGHVPSTMEELTSLPGVGRKTANVVLANAFGQDTIAVDTHVFRVSNRIGLANADNVDLTEKQLMDVLPKECWSNMHHYIIWHGRKVCIARKPKCDQCVIKDYCKYYINNHS